MTTRVTFDTRIVYDDWGLDWVGEKKSRGLTWSEDELEEIEHFYQFVNDSTSNTVALDLLKYVSSTPSIRRKFHPNHVENSSKIRSGIERYKNLKEQKNRVNIIM
jgi:hypothetical protein